MQITTKAGIFSSFLERVNLLYEKSPNDFDKMREFTVETTLDSNKQGRLILKAESLFYSLREEHPCKLKRQGNVTVKFNETQVGWLKNSTAADDRIKFEIISGKDQAKLTTSWGQMMFYTHRSEDTTDIDFSNTRKIMTVERENFQKSIRAFRGLSFVRMRCDSDEETISAMPQDTGISGMAKIQAKSIVEDSVLWFSVGVLNAGVDMFTKSDEITIEKIRVKRPSTDKQDDWVVFSGDDDFRFAMNSNLTKTLSAEEHQNDVFDVVKNNGPKERIALVGSMLRSNLASFIKGFDRKNLDQERIQATIDPDMSNGSTLATRTLSKKKSFVGFMRLSKLGCAVEVPLKFCSFGTQTELKLPLDRILNFVGAMPEAKAYLFTYYTEDDTMLVEDDEGTACWVFDCGLREEVDVDLEDDDIKAKQA